MIGTASSWRQASSRLPARDQARDNPALTRRWAKVVKRGKSEGFSPLLASRKSRFSACFPRWRVRRSRKGFPLISPHDRPRVRLLNSTLSFALWFKHKSNCRTAHWAWQLRDSHCECDSPIAGCSACGSFCTNSNFRPRHPREQIILSDSNRRQSPNPAQSTRSS
jgi:hypothetical protein